MHSYEDALKDAREEVSRLRALRIEVDLRIAKLERSIAGLATLCGEPEAVLREGLTDAVRAILKASADAFMPTQMRDELKRSGFDLSKYSNALSAIHTTLKRIAEQGEATIVLIGDVTAYRWTANDQSALEALRESASMQENVVQFLEDYVRKRA